VRVRTSAHLRQLVDCVLVAGDVGVKVLCTFVVGKIVPPQNDDEWRRVLNPANDVALEPAEVRQLLAKCTTVTMTHSVRGSKRGLAETDRASAEAAEAASVLARSGVATGGVRSLTSDQLAAHLECYMAQRETIYRDSVQRAMDGARRQKLIGRYQRRSRDVDSLTAAIRLFRAYLLVGANAQRKQLRADIMLAPTAFDKRAIVFLGQPQFGDDVRHNRGYKAAPMKSYVDAVAKRFRCITVSEYYTSQKCSKCGAQVKRTRGWSVRYVRCGHCDKANTTSVKKSGLARHSAEENKDVVAAMSMLWRIGLPLLIDGGRPVEWCSDAAVTLHEINTTPMVGGEQKRPRRGNSSGRAAGKRHASAAEPRKRQVATRDVAARKRGNDIDSDDERVFEVAASRRATARRTRYDDNDDEPPDSDDSDFDEDDTPDEDSFRRRRRRRGRPPRY
jgi:hypothetical protein